MLGSSCIIADVTVLVELNRALARVMQRGRLISPIDGSIWILRAPPGVWKHSFFHQWELEALELRFVEFLFNLLLELHQLSLNLWIYIPRLLQWPTCQPYDITTISFDLWNSFVYLFHSNMGVHPRWRIISHGHLLL